MKKQNNVWALLVRNTEKNLPNCAHKTNKGITLIALIITIIIMLILALVSISIIKNQGIITKSKDAADKYNQKAEEEQEELTFFERLLGQYNGEETAEEPYVTPRTEVTYKGQTLKVGDYVEYNELSNGEKTWTTDASKGTGGDAGLTSKTYTTEDMGWRVLGLDTDGNLELISDKQTSEYLYLKGKAASKEDENGKINGEEQLNEMCDALYGQGEKAESARSVTDDDINAILGYNKKGYKEEYKEDENNWIKMYYGMKTTYKETKSIGDWFKIDGSNEYTRKIYTYFINIDGIKATDEKPITVESNEYMYTREEFEDKVDSKILDMVFGENSSSNFWLASRCVSARDENASWGLFDICCGDLSNYCLYKSDGGDYNTVSHMRPIVSLKSDVQLSGSSETGWRIQ